MKRSIITIAVLLSIAVSGAARAEVTPPKGERDARVRVVEYHSRQVVRVTAFFGVSTHIQFGEDEVIKDVAVGDDAAWKIVPRGRNLFIKPVAKQADTNVTVLTDRRVYHFTFVVNQRAEKDPNAWADPSLVYSLSFVYPDDEAARGRTMAALQATQEQQRQAAERERQAVESIRTQLSDAARIGGNWDYWVSGSDEIAPTAARDDGRFIYLTFSLNRDMPAIYTVDEAGNEALVQTHVQDGNTIAVQRMARRLMLRKGSAVAMVINKSWNPNGGSDNRSGTIAPGVERVTKGGSK